MPIGMQLIVLIINPSPHPICKAEAAQSENLPVYADACQVRDVVECKHAAVSINTHFYVQLREYILVRLSLI